MKHGLGFVPMVWIRNLPGPSSTGDAADGACTFRTAIETQIEIDYQLSQAGRGLKYSSDPTLLIKEPASTDSEIVKGAGNALVVSEKGDAKLLEIGGTASAAVIEYVRTLRELALESVHGNRANADRLTAAQSGRALELMNQGLDLAGRQSAHQLRRRRIAFARAHGAAGIAGLSPAHPRPGDRSDSIRRRASRSTGRAGIHPPRTTGKRTRRR